MAEDEKKPEGWESEASPEKESETQPEPAKKPDTVLSQDELNALLKNAAGQPQKVEPGVASMPLTDLGGSPASQAASSIDMLMDVALDVRIELGRTHMAVEDILKLQPGGVVTLDKLAGDFVDVLVNDKLVARGEVLILNDNFCVRVAEIVAPQEREDVAAD
jgi:flagellar motor switch protein FliN/FliY